MADYKYCRECGGDLLSDDISIHRKLIDRGATDFLCIDCLAALLKTTRPDIERLIAYYRESGQCTLFR